MTSQIESLSKTQYTPLYKNKQFESKIIQWRLLSNLYLFLFLTISAPDELPENNSAYEEPTNEESFQDYRIHAESIQGYRIHSESIQDYPIHDIPDDSVDQNPETLSTLIHQEKIQDCYQAQESYSIKESNSTKDIQRSHSVVNESTQEDPDQITFIQVDPDQEFSIDDELNSKENGSNEAEKKSCTIENSQNPVENEQNPVENGSNPVENGSNPVDNGLEPVEEGEEDLPLPTIVSFRSGRKVFI